MSKLKSYLILFLIFCVLLLVSQKSSAQVDSIVRSIKDSLVSKLIVDDIPQKTFGDKFMYPHRWYVKQLLRPKITDFDTSYIMSNKRRLTITLPITKKYYGFNLNDITKNKKLKFSPNTYYQVGFNFSNILLTFGFSPGIRFGSKPDKGYSRSRDYQLLIVGRRVVSELNFQHYKGFYIRNASDFVLSPQTITSTIIRPDVKVISFGVNTLFIYNYKKYSLRGAFSFTDVQRKSAGTFMTGFYHSHVLFSSTDTDLIKNPFRYYFSDLLNGINKISVITIGVSGGYAYTYVHKKIIASTVMNIGLGGQKINYTTLADGGHTLSIKPTENFTAKAALRYDNLRFFSGIMAAYDKSLNFNSTRFNTEHYSGRLVLFAGYRFNIKKNGRKVLKAMRLIDYN